MLLLSLLACDDDKTGSGPFALGFDGPPDCVEASTGGVDAPDAFTIELWLRADPEAGERALPIAVWTGVFNLRQEEGDSVLFAVGDEGGAVYGVGLADGTLHHLAGTFAEGTATLWVDGAKVAFDDELVVADASDNFRVGCSGTGDAFEGLLDEVRVSSVARYTETFDRPSGPFEDDADTLALFHFDEGEGVDVSGGDWSGTASETEWIEFALPTTEEVEEG